MDQMLPAKRTHTLISALIVCVLLLCVSVLSLSLLCVLVARPLTAYRSPLTAHRSPARGRAPLPYAYA